MKRKVLVTGASRGLGAVVVKSLPEYEVIPFTRKDFDYLNPQSQSEIPEVDIVIHCAGGGLGLREPLLAVQHFHSLFMVNLAGAAEINRLVIPYMKDMAWGRVVHVCSIASGEAVGSVGYNTVKAALGAYVRSLGRELARSGVVVSGIAPGGFLAPGNAMERLQANNPEAFADFLKNRLARGFMGNATELIPLLRYLISDDASMMGGCVVPIDAGEGKYYS